jgi:arginyl-tRNA synthetase
LKNVKGIVAEILLEQVDSLKTVFTNVDDLSLSLEYPPNPNLGDLAFPCFPLAKHLRKSPVEIAKDLSSKVEHEFIEKLEPTGPYLNVFLKKSLLSGNVLREILSSGASFGQLNLGANEVPIDMSSPNIAKPFSMGHLRSTVIGNAIANIVSKCGYKPIRINYLGDWGTQFGKLIAAYKSWGDEAAVKANPIKELLKLYVEFHEKAEESPELVDEGRKWFKELENGNEEALGLWKWFREESLKEFNKIYELLDVSFDSLNGEAFYNDKMDPVVEELRELGLLVESDGAEVVDLSEWELPPALIKKSDGATLYATRDLAAAIDRFKQFDFAYSLYVVGHEQSLHFDQLKKVLLKMGHEWAENLKHIPFGMILKDGKKMSTRKGKVVLLEEVLEEAIGLAAKSIEEKNPSLIEKKQVAKDVGVGAVIFHDLKNYRLNNVEFSLDEMLRFEGETGPYIQYTHARACSILRKGNVGEQDFAGNSDVLEVVMNEPKAWEIVMSLESFPAVIERSFKNFDPSIVAKYLIDLSRIFNKYYANVHILTGEADIVGSRLHLVKAVTIVLNEGLRLLGIKSPEEM